MNHLNGVERLANRYRAMRHGESKANAAGVIISTIESDASGDWGLSAAGQRQALAAAEASGLSADTVICSSDFSRALETAQIVRAHLGAAPVTSTPALRERRFGEWEGSAVANYARVWAADQADASQPAGGVEPAGAVLERATSLVAELERRFADRDILLVSHGDTLQILQAGFQGAAASAHRSLPHLGTAEIRPLSLARRAPQASQGS